MKVKPTHLCDTHNPCRTECGTYSLSSSYHYAKVTCKSCLKFIARHRPNALTTTTLGLK
jgi:hypothetical protein